MSGSRTSEDAREVEREGRPAVPRAGWTVGRLVLSKRTTRSA